MRMLLLSLLISAAAVLTLPVARAQDDATQQQIDKLSGEIQDLRDAVGVQDKRLAALETKINDLNDKINSSGSGGVASADDLKKLADVVQEIDKKRQADNEAVLKELEKLDKALGVASSGRKASPVTSADNPTPPPGGPQKGYYYEIKSGDNLTAISKAYREQGVKVSVEQIQAANPGLNPRNMVVGKKIFIPDPNAK